jgi:hypothetical protein
MQYTNDKLAPILLQKIAAHRIGYIQAELEANAITTLS